MLIIAKCLWKSQLFETSSKIILNKWFFSAEKILKSCFLSCFPCKFLYLLQRAICFSFELPFQWDCSMQWANLYPTIARPRLLFLLFKQFLILKSRETKQKISVEDVLWFVVPLEVSQKVHTLEVVHFWELLVDTELILYFAALSSSN